MVESKDRLAAGYVKRIYVNRQLVNDPSGQPISVRTSAGVISATEVQIDGPSKVVFDPDKEANPRVWIQTFAKVRTNGS